MHQSAMCANDDHTFWPLTTKYVAAPLDPRAHGGEVGAGVGLGEALAPDLLGGEDLREVRLLLLLGAVRHDRRPGHAEPDHADVRRRLRRAPSPRGRSPGSCTARRRRRTPSARSARRSRPRTSLRLHSRPKASSKRCEPPRQPRRSSGRFASSQARSSARKAASSGVSRRSTVRTLQRWAGQAEAGAGTGTCTISRRRTGSRLTTAMVRATPSHCDQRRCALNA